ncbi:MAG: pantoate kinase [Candidatus Natronoplasma sp.]
MTTKAFCPAHITGFFSLPLDSEEMGDKEGSRGAGFSIELGATSEVEVDGKGWNIFVNGEPTSFMPVEKTVYNFAEGGTIEIETDLPFSQGFGMSGACALASGTAVLKELGEDTEKALSAAHKAEMFCRTGMGDVVGQYHGGFEIRVKGGLPPHGEIKVNKIDREAVIAIAGNPLLTPDVLRDPFMAGWINAVGEDIMDVFLPEDGFDRFLELSRRFAEETEFPKEKVEKLLESGNEVGKGSMAMIGNSVFFFGDTDELKNVLIDDVNEDDIYITDIDNEGVRVI